MRRGLPSSLAPARGSHLLAGDEELVLVGVAPHVHGGDLERRGERERGGKKGEKRRVRQRFHPVNVSWFIT